MARRIALIHDWLTGMRGGEKVLEALCDLFPAADVHTLIHLKGSVTPSIERHRIFTSPLQAFPRVGNYYRHLLPLMPWAIEQLNFSGYDLLISTSHCVAKGALPRPGAKHYCYCHTPMRYVWDQYDQYFSPERSGYLTRTAMSLVRPYLRRWDVRSNARVNRFIANSANVAERIQRLYGRESTVIYPPVDCDLYAQTTQDLESLSRAREPFFLIVSALAPYKRVDLAIEAFQKLRLKLIVIGDGQEMASLRQRADPSITFLGWLGAEQLRWHYARCEALVFPGEEDFGIVPVEAMSAGRPVIAYRKGGALETVVDGVTGIFFDEPSANSIINAVDRFKDKVWDSTVIQSHARSFDRSRCIAKFREMFSDYKDEMS